MTNEQTQFDEFIAQVEATPLPEEPLRRYQQIASEIAHMISQKWMSTEINVLYLGDSAIFHVWSDSPLDVNENEGILTPYLTARNIMEPHTLQMLASLDFIDQVYSDKNGEKYVITEKSLQLLEKPIVGPKVFISYQHKTSSAFALLIEARLRIAGVHDVFIDKDIPLADEWQSTIDTSVENCDWFICLVSHGTLDRKGVRDEVQMANDLKKKRLFIFHGMTDEERDTLIKDNKQLATIAEEIRKVQFKWVQYTIQVEGEGDDKKEFVVHRAEDYETAVNAILNRLNLPTY